MGIDVQESCFSGAIGFSGRSFPVAARLVHLWGNVTTSSVDLSTWRDPVPGPQFFRACHSACAGLWQITTDAVEYRRLIQEGTALPLDDIAFSQIPVGVQPPTRRTVMQLQINASDGAGLRQFQMDCNQSLCIVAQEVCVSWMGPPGTQNVQGYQPAARSFPLPGFVIDAFIDVGLSRIEQAPGDAGTALLTKHLFVPAATRGSIEIPAYANAVTIYQEPTLGNASVMWTQTLGDPNGVSGSESLAALPFIPGLRRTEQESILPNVSHLWSDLDLDNTRFYTLIFEIRP